MLRRTLGTRDLALFAIATVVGSRWIATAAHAGPGSLILWLVAAICFAVPLAIATAALTVKHPHAGGIYIWTRHDYGPWHGFLCFWLYWLGSVVWFPGAALFYAGAAFFSNTPAGGIASRAWLLVAALALIWIALGPNLLGVRFGQRLADLGAAASWVLAMVLVAAAFVFLSHHASATTFHLMPVANWDTAVGFATLAYAMTGMEAVGLMGAEIKDPQRSLPRAAAIGSGFATLYYVGATAAVLVMLRPDQVSELQGLTQAGAASASVLGLPWLPAAIAVLLACTAMGQFGALGASNARLPYAAGAHGLMPKAFGKVHPRWSTPHISILVMGGTASALLLAMQIGDTLRAAYDAIVSLMVIVGFLPYVYMFGSAWKAGKRLSAASGMAVTVIAIVCSVVPPGGVTNVWVFEGKLALGTAISVGTAWAIYRRRAAESSLNVMSPG